MRPILVRYDDICDFPARADIHVSLPDAKAERLGALVQPHAVRAAGCCGRGGAPRGLLLLYWGEHHGGASYLADIPDH
jgi:hypothetical protein